MKNVEYSAFHTVIRIRPSHRVKLGVPPFVGPASTASFVVVGL